MKEFAGKTVVITGGASGIGLAVARALGGRGMRVALADVEAQALDTATASLAEAGIESMGVVTDVRDRAALRALADQVWQRFGAAHLVMHNAGVVVFGPAQELTDADWDWTLQVNLHGAINGVQAFLPRMLEQDEGGHMLFTASFAGLVANRNLAPYNVSKAAVVALAESLAKDLKETDIGVSVLCPMRVQSNIERSARNRPRELGGGGRAAGATVEQQGRILAVEDVAELVVAAIARDDLYIHTHAEAREFVARRAERVQRGFRYAL